MCYGEIDSLARYIFLLTSLLLASSFFYSVVKVRGDLSSPEVK